MAHPQEIVQPILERYSRRHSEAHLLFEAAELHRPMQPDLVEIGHMNLGRWRHIAEVYQDLEMLRHVDLDGFLYDPQPPRTNPRLVLAWCSRPWSAWCWAARATARRGNSLPSSTTGLSAAARPPKLEAVIGVLRALRRGSYMPKKAGSAHLMARSTSSAEHSRRRLRW
jgi:hypothetical protein